MLCSNHDLQHRWLGQRGCCEWGTRQWVRSDTSSYWASCFSHAWVNRCLLFAKRCEDAHFFSKSKLSISLAILRDKLSCQMTSARWNQWKYKLMFWMIHFCNFPNIWISFGFSPLPWGCKENRGSYLSLPRSTGTTMTTTSTTLSTTTFTSTSHTITTTGTTTETTTSVSSTTRSSNVGWQRWMDGIFLGGKIGSGV